MKRREFLEAAGKTVASLGLPPIILSACTSPQQFAAAKSKPPNILFIITDQQHARLMSCASNKYIKTPAMDSLAANGTRFERAYCAQPLCVPSRMAIFTGTMPHENGITINTNRNAQWNHSPMMGRIFADAGYNTGYVGKWHLTVPLSDSRLHGFETLLNIRDNDIDMRIPKSCISFLKTHRNQPFLLVASFVNPHDVCEWARGQNLRNGRIGPPPSGDKCPPLPANFEIPENEPDVIRRVQEINRDFVYPTAKWTNEKWRQYIWAYYRMTELADSGIGKVLDALREFGLEDNTLVIFTSDHGDGGGSHHWNQKQVLYDEPARVPFIVSYKGVTKPGTVSDRLINTGLDIIPTMCDYAGIKPPPHMKGRSVRPLAEGKKVKNQRNFVVTETEFCDPGNSFGLSGRMLRTDRYKYVIYNKGKLREQLFDMQKDPGEMKNLAADSRFANVLNSHRKTLADWCTQSGDSFPVLSPR